MGELPTRSAEQMLARLFFLIHIYAYARFKKSAQCFCSRWLKCYRKGKAMNISGIIGLGCFFGLLVLAAIMGGAPDTFVDMPSAIIVAGLTLGAGLMAFGFKDLWDGLWALRVFVVRVPDETLGGRQARVLRGLIPPAYAAGALGTIIGMMQMLATLKDLSSVRAGIACDILTVLYAIVLAEGLLRPGARYIEHQNALRERQRQT